MNKYRPIATNRRAKFDYEIEDRILAGIVLTGPEVKSIRNGHVSLKGSFAHFRNAELWLNNMHVSPYPPAHDMPHDSERPRKLLVHKSQLSNLHTQKQSGRNLVVCSIGVSGPYIKAEIGIGRGKKRYDKRETIKRRQAERDTKRSIKKSVR